LLDRLVHPGACPCCCMSRSDVPLRSQSSATLQAPETYMYIDLAVSQIVLSKACRVSQNSACVGTLLGRFRCLAILCMETRKQCCLGLDIHGRFRSKWIEAFALGIQDIVLLLRVI